MAAKDYYQITNTGTEPLELFVMGVARDAAAKAQLATAQANLTQAQEQVDEYGQPQQPDPQQLQQWMQQQAVQAQRSAQEFEASGSANKR